MKLMQNMCATAILGLVSSSLMAGMTVSPLRLDLNSQSSVSSLTVFNKGTNQDTLQIQASVKSWTEANDKDVYTNQNNILLLPPIFGVPSGQSQVVRVALLQPNTTNLEQTYRVFLNQFNPEQVNLESAGKVSTALSILLNVSIPVFIAPSVPKTINVTWSLGAQSKQLLPLIATNIGNTHVHFAKVTVTNSAGVTVAEGETPLYVLAGSAMTDTLQVVKPLQKGQTYTVKAITDDTQYPTLTGQVSF